VFGYAIYLIVLKIFVFLVSIDLEFVRAFGVPKNKSILLIITINVIIEIYLTYMLV